MLLKDYLKGKLAKKDLSLIPRSFDVIGDIAVFSDFPEELEKKEKIIADALIKLNNNIKTVAKKTKKVSGRHRTRKLEVIAGERKKETIHKENKVIAKLDVEKCYFTPRLNAERLRIASLAKKNEKILVMFSGVAIYPLVISRNSNAKEIYGIEVNKTAHKYAVENLKLNKINNIKLFLGDVKKIVPRLKVKFDRIVMPLPLNATDYLKDALKVAKKGAMIHLYIFDTDKALVKLKKFKILRITRTGQISPGKYRYCIDFKV